MHVWWYTYAISDVTLVQVWLHSCESPLPWIHWRWWIWMIIMFHIQQLPFTCFLGNEVLKYSLNAGFLKPRQMSWSQWGNCSCWLVATICHCPRDQFDEQWRLLDTVGAKLSLKKMRGRRKSQWVSGWDSEWWKLWWHHCTACGSSWGPYLMWILWNTLVLWKSKPVGAVWEVHSIRTVWEGDWGVCAETSSQSSEMR